MSKRLVYLAGCVMLSVLFSVEGGTANSPMPRAPYAHEDEATLPNGVIGVSLQIGAERIGDPCVLYVAMVHPEGPAHQAGLAHGAEIVTVDGTAVSGKAYEQVVKMIRGEAGTVVKLGLKDKQDTRELSITRVDGGHFPKDRRDPTGILLDRGA